VTALVLVRHGPTAATERAAFAADEPLSDAGAAAAAALAPHLPAADTVLSSPALRCRLTADAVGLTPALVPDLAECRFGAWEGRTFAEITAREPGLVDGWLRDPDAAPHGGESLAAFAARVRAWLETLTPSREGRTVLAFTHAGVIKVALVAAMRAPVEAFWRIDVSPLSLTELHAHDGAWTLVRANWTPGA
jgi:broad specificity phosphatase PhoE